MKRMKAVLTSIFFLVVLLSPTAIFASGDFFDDFESGFVAEWEIYSGNWVIESFLSNNWLKISTSNNSQSELQRGDFDWSDYELRFKMFPKNGVDRNIFVRVQDQRVNHAGLNLPVSYGFHIKNNIVILQKWLPTGVEIPLRNGDVSIPNNDVHDVKIVVIGNHIQLFVNDFVTPVIDYTDTTNPHLNGRIALASFAGSTPTEILFDDVRVTHFGHEVVGPFELPFGYPDRGDDNEEAFSYAFFDRYYSLFDHDPKHGNFTNFLGDSYVPEECDVDRAACYDSHTGIDFIKLEGDNVLSVGTGEVVYRSEDNPGNGNDKCKPKGPLGCVVLVDYSSDEHPDLYGIFAHLSEISIDESDSIDENIQIGVTGKTGSASGKHLHFASMIKLPELGLNAFNKMKKSDWDNLTNQIAAHESLVFNVGKKSVCKYVAPNGSTFVMVDPNGWMGGDSDPWAASTEDGGCGIESQILWKFNVEI